MKKIKIAIISSSIRPGRNTHKVAAALQSHLSEGRNAETTLIDLAKNEIPLMEYVLSRHPKPPKDVVKIGEQLTSADAMIFVSPEYNGSFSPILKNLIDYFPKQTYERKPIGVASVVTGPNGGIRAALQMQQLVLALFAYPIPRMLTVPNVQHKFNENNELTDEAFGKKIEQFVNEFLWFSEAICKKKNDENPMGQS
jgi:NAD(P)H-dependent FMN reductase